VLRRLRIENLVLIREADLELGPGLNVVTGETGAGKTILTHAVGLLLGARGDVSYVGPAAGEAYVEAELDLPDGLLAEEGFAAVEELAPDDEPGLAVARRIFADGRSRAYAWGRALAREDAAALVERLVAMSGQFEQRRLARPAYQLDLLDAFAGDEQLRRRAEAASAWRALRDARRRLDELAGDAVDRDVRADELRALLAACDGLAPDAEDALRAERDVLRNAAALAAAAVEAAETLAPELTEAEGAADLAARAERALRPVAEVTPELAATSAEIVDAAERLRDSASRLRAFLATLEAEPGRLDAIEGELERIADAKRRFRAASVADLLALAGTAGEELEALEAGADPLARAEAAAGAAETAYRSLVEELRAARRAAAAPFAEAVREELAALGLGEGELGVALSPRDDGPTGADAVELSIRPNAGLPLAPIASTASGGELSRIALALRIAAHQQAGEPTIVFDEIDAGIGGQTAHAVADALGRLASQSQVIVITHLPQIASVADRHFRVDKVEGDPTRTHIDLLDDDERRGELERMLGGRELLSRLEAVGAPAGSSDAAAAEVVTGSRPARRRTKDRG
jgi:DNA repair protein RecN (Recombination protein N)